MKLHVMTKTEVLIIIEKGQQRYVCGSDDTLKRYENEELKPKESDKKIKDGTVETEDQIGALGVCPLEDTPDKLDLDLNLATVLGHSKGSSYFHSEPEEEWTISVSTIGRQNSFWTSDAALAEQG